jgi:hypothetical protein
VVRAARQRARRPVRTCAWSRNETALPPRSQSTAWCYVDTETGEVDRIEVWAWEDEFSLEKEPWVLAVDSDEDTLITPAVAANARDIVCAASESVRFKVAFDPNHTRLAGAVEANWMREAAALREDG